MATRTPVYNPGPETYEKELVPILFRPWATRLVDRTQPRTGERVLDVACGTGIVARLAAARVGPGGTVVGLDINPAMLDEAQRSAGDRSGPTPMISWKLGDATALPFEDASFDVVFCQQGLQFTPDRAAAVREMRRVVAPRGRVAVSVWRGPDMHEGLEAFGEVLARHLPAEAAVGQDAPFSFGDPEQLRATFADAGFSDIRITLDVGTVRYRSPEHMIDAVGGAFAPLAAAIGALEGDARDAFLRDMTEAVRPYLDDEGVLEPMIANVVLARP